MHRLLPALVIALSVVALSAQAQTQQAPPATQKPAPAAQKPVTATQKPAPAARLSATLFVTDPAGKPIPDVTMEVVVGPVDRGGTTDGNGIVRLTSLKPGTYRLRFEGKGFITFEREITLKAGPAAEIEITLNPAPAPPPEPPPPVQPPAAQQPSLGSGGEAGQAKALYLADWIDSNLIGRNEPKKETMVGQTRAETASVLQVRDPIKDVSSADSDQMVYVIAGRGTVRFEGRVENLDAGWFVVIPRGTRYSLERRGGNPLITLVVAAPAKS